MKYPQNVNDAVEILKRNHPKCRISFVGSCIIESVSPKDWDILVYLKNGHDELLHSCYNEGYKIEGERSEDYPEELGFNSLRKNDINLIITQDIHFYHNFRSASQICKVLDVQDRKKRVQVHAIAFNGITPKDLKEF